MSVITDLEKECELERVIILYLELLLLLESSWFHCGQSSAFQWDWTRQSNVTKTRLLIPLQNTLQMFKHTCTEILLKSPATTNWIKWLQGVSLVGALIFPANSLDRVRVWKDLQNLAAYPCRHWSCRETLQSKRNHEAAGKCKRDFFVILAIHANDWVTQLPKLLPVSISPQQTSPAQLSHVTVYTPNHLLFFSFQASMSVHEFLNNVIIFTTCLDLIL